MSFALVLIVVYEKIFLHNYAVSGQMFPYIIVTPDKSSLRTCTTAHAADLEIAL